MKCARLLRALAPNLALASLTLLALLFAIPASAQSAPTTPVIATYAPPKDPTVLRTTFVDLDSLTTTATPVGSSRPVFDNPTVAMDKLEVHINTLNPGQQAHPIHRHPWEEIILVREGQVDFNINGQIHHAGPGALIFFASNDPHNVRNVGDTPATYYVVNFVPDTASSPAAANAPSAAQQNLPGKFASTVIDTNALVQIPSAAGSHVTVIQSQPTVTFLALESHISTPRPRQAHRDRHHRPQR